MKSVCELELGVQAYNSAKEEEEEGEFGQFFHNPLRYLERRLIILCIFACHVFFDGN